MPVYIDSFDKLYKKLKIEDNGEAQAFLTNTCYKKMDKYVPMRDGLLRTVVSLTPNSITYESEYASYQYYGEWEDGTHIATHYTTPGTGPYWDRKMLSVEEDNIVKLMNARYGRK